MDADCTLKQSLGPPIICHSLYAHRIPFAVMSLKVYNIICKALTPNVSPEAQSVKKLRSVVSADQKSRAMKNLNFSSLRSECDFTCSVRQLPGAPTFLVFLFRVNFWVHYSQFPSTMKCTAKTLSDCQINQSINIVFLE